MTIAAVAVFVGVYALIATERVHRVVAALAGAAVMLVLQIIDAEDAFHGVDTGVDWEVIFLLLGMMLLVAVVRRTGLFEYLAIWSAKRARGRPYRILVILCLVTAIASALLDNVTTVLLVAPVTVLIAERLGTSPVPYLIAEVLASNIGGTATLVGDPPNIIIGSRAGLSYTDFLVNLGPIALLILIIFLILARALFRSDLTADPDRVTEVMELDEREAIQDPGLLIRSGIVLGAVTVGFLLHSILHYDPAIIALLGAGVLLAVASLEFGELARDVEWETLVFFAGLFIMVGALVKVGVIENVARMAADATGGSALLAAMLVLVVSAVLSGVVDNIPYVAAMAPVVASLTAGPSGGEVLWWALALGADLGGNATAVGASANVVVLGIADRSGYPIRFVHFLKYGVLVTAISILVAAAYLWIRYFVFS
ncbi:MAG TPA: ArsB/NhaD family transporter [Actinomycetota bacterium]|jgi:Na+/H+ antiporter NhaD/arsenite permease-like protein|nr:ArsB/NhaD family transporter [Actinomycetota bacterium]